MLQLVAFGLWRGPRPLWAVTLLVAGLGLLTFVVVHAIAQRRRRGDVRR